MGMNMTMPEPFQSQLMRAKGVDAIDYVTNAAREAYPELFVSKEEEAARLQMHLHISGKDGAQ